MLKKAPKTSVASGKMVSMELPVPTDGGTKILSQIIVLKILKTSVPDPWNSGTDPDSRVRTFD